MYPLLSSCHSVLLSFRPPVLPSKAALYGFSLVSPLHVSLRSQVRGRHGGSQHRWAFLAVGGGTAWGRGMGTGGLRGLRELSSPDNRHSGMGIWTCPPSSLCDTGTLGILLFKLGPEELCLLGKTIVFSSSCPFPSSAEPPIRLSGYAQTWFLSCTIPFFVSGTLPCLLLPHEPLFLAGTWANSFPSASP